MEKWLLAVGYDIDKFNDTQREWLKYGVFICMATDMTEAVHALSKKNNFLLVAIFSDTTDYIAFIKIIRELTSAPILILKHQYDGEEKIAVIEAGADEYIQWPDTIQESVASGRAQIRRYREINKQESNSLTTASYGDIFLCVEYRKVFVRGREVIFTKQEFDFLRLLLTHISKVFTYEYICEAVWGNEYEKRNSNALWCLVSKVRRKISALGGADGIIQTVRFLV